jgi:hypothetical protein
LFGLLKKHVQPDTQKFNKAWRQMLVDGVVPTGVSEQQMTNMAVAIHKGKTNMMHHLYKDFDQNNWENYKAWLVVRHSAKYSNQKNTTPSVRVQTASAHDNTSPNATAATSTATVTTLTNNPPAVTTATASRARGLGRDAAKRMKLRDEQANAKKTRCSSTFESVEKANEINAKTLALQTKLVKSIEIDSHMSQCAMMLNAYEGQHKYQHLMSPLRKQMSELILV